MALDDLIYVSGNGLHKPDKNKVQASLIEWYKSIFGSDIDLETGTADGDFVQNLGLILNSCFDAISEFDHQMHIDSATGSNLDSLVALSNIWRKPATYSKASLQVTNGLNEAVTEFGLTFYDGKTEWIADEESISFAPNETKVVEVHCTTPGKIEALSGSINTTIQTSYLSVYQPNDAIVGNTRETDDELKRRFYETRSSNSGTTLEGLRASLLTISGIKDVKIYNNNSGNTQIMKDATEVAAHDVYIVIRKEEGLTIDDSIIGKRIHSLMTSGIQTAEMGEGVISGNDKYYQYTDSNYGSIIQEATEDVYWKEAIPAAPEIVITLYKKENYTSDVEQIVSDAVCKYMNAKPIDEDIPNMDGIINVASIAIRKIGKNVAEVHGATIAGGKNYVVPNTYYKYNSVTVIGTELKTARLNDTFITYESGMTWGDFIDSEYNEVGASADDDGHVYVGTARVKTFGTEAPIEETDSMDSSGWYIYASATFGVFYVLNRNYTFEVGQDFDTWLDSEYNPPVGDRPQGRIYKTDGKLWTYDPTHYELQLYLMDDNYENYISPDDLITNGKSYATSI